MIRMLIGDCRDVLATLDAESVQCVVTSPPYYGLRDYGTGQWDGGDAGCRHSIGGQVQDSKAPGAITMGVRPGVDASHCRKCGATRVDRQIGLEATPDEYLATMVQVFREVRRVLRDDGTCWVNMGDSYNNFRSQMGPGQAVHGRDDLRGKRETGTRGWNGAKEKDLLMMPARLALALQADGWWIRSDIIWAKPNPMPESVTDRPTSAHEHVFLLTRNARYFYDADAVREPSVSDHPSGSGYARPEQLSRGGRGQANGWTDVEGARNLRNVWTIATHAYPDAHFATFPPELAERCIKAGTSERGCCAACGAPWVRVVERTNGTRRGDGGEVAAARLSGGLSVGQPARMGDPAATTTGWSPSCNCASLPPCHDERQEPTGRYSPGGVDSRVGAAGGTAAPAQPIPCTVLDPFAGAGTTLLVADRLQRHAIGIELNPAYAAMTTDRVRADAGLFVEIAAE